MNPQPAFFRWRRPALALGASLLTLVAVVAAVPPARVWATTVLRQIGVITLVEEASPPAPPDPNAGPVPTSTPIPPDRPAELTTVAQVAQEAGFVPLVPARLPEGYTQARLGVMEYINDALRHDGLGTFIRYENASTSDFLEVQQSRFVGEAPREFAIGNTPIVDVTVQGVAGVWLEGLPRPDGTGGTLNMLLWWEDGYVHSLQSTSLTLDAMLAVAESLQ